MAKLGRFVLGAAAPIIRNQMSQRVGTI